MSWNVNWRKINRILHRDIGYFFFGMSVIYGLSGIALNHLNDWDPNYVIEHAQVSIPLNLLSNQMSHAQAQEVANYVGIQQRIKKHYYPRKNSVKIFLKDGSLTVNTSTGRGTLEAVRRRKIFYEINYLHYNHPKFLWTWFSDLFAAGLVIMAVTGLFVLKGKNGLKKRGIWFVLAGVIIPIIFLMTYL